MIYTDYIQAEAVSSVIDPYDHYETMLTTLMPKLSETMIASLQENSSDPFIRTARLVIEDVVGDLLEEGSPFSKMFEAQQRVMAYPELENIKHGVWEATDTLAWSAWVDLANSLGIDSEDYQEDYEKMIPAIILAL